MEPGWFDVFPLTVLVLLGVGVPAGLLIVSKVLKGPQPGAEAKGEPYECGLSQTVGTASERFSIKFYLVGMLFLVFDIEVAFLYPWAVHYGQGGIGMFWLLVAFLIILEAGYCYLYRKGALDWE